MWCFGKWFFPNIRKHLNNNEFPHDYYTRRCDRVSKLSIVMIIVNVILGVLIPAVLTIIESLLLRGSDT